DSVVTTPAPPPTPLTLQSVSPNSLNRGARDVKLELTGTGFRSDFNLNLGGGIEITSKEFVDASHVRGTVTVARNAETGPRVIAVTAGDQTASLESAFSIGDDIPPTAKFTITPAKGTINTTFVFDASLSTDTDGRITSYQWTFNDSNALKGKRVEKRFPDAGLISVKLTVSDDKKSFHTVEKNLDVADNAVPEAAFTITPSSGYTSTVFTFDASSSSDPDGSIRSYNWEFGDGKKSTGMRTTHKFADGGDFSVVLTVEDSSGVKKEATRKVRVTFFDVEKAKDEIDAVCTDFLRLFGDLEVLSAEQIVVGFSRNCAGRAREIEIIEAEQPIIDTGFVQLLGPTEIQAVTPSSARASLTARFYGTYTDGSDYDGVATHNFTMVNENGEWKICNFSVVRSTGAESLKRLFPE
ncbi:PKD domain-containing protein, partial [bacterium]|nr:PKD domain-containing protein [bacterium]